MAKSPSWSQEKYIKALRFAAQAHDGQEYPGSGLPYIIHPCMACMETIAALEMEIFEDPDLAVQCALLHDVMEDTDIDQEELADALGLEVAQGVAFLSKDNNIEDGKIKLNEYISRLAQARKEVRMVKLADRISNLHTSPPDWDGVKIREYLAESIVILAKLGDASPYLRKRLAAKIEAYKKFAAAAE